MNEPNAKNSNNKELDTVEIKDYTEANRRSWNQVAARHHKGKEERKKLFRQKGYSVLDETITAKLKAYGLEGKSVAHLCCNDGTETLSLKNLGAASCIGFDISDLAIDEARKLAIDAGIECEFMQTDVYEIPEQYSGTFDLIYISAGSLIWFPDLSLFFQMVQRLLKDGGNVLIYDIHPVLFMLDENDKEHPLEMKFSYFIDEPRVYNEGLDYINKETYEGAPYYVFDPTLSHIMSCTLSNGLMIQSFDEYEHDISALYDHLKDQEVKLPKCYVLSARKQRNALLMD
ncbi:bifunctional 2-polyprenyl-6-hydroxyphenol methylase/3-demethylubiquinol 3-O-methyltransferase UbiG [Paenibacillus sp. NAIST15-1]|uniref:class I SAM-dependent methyltransferase n=1 Tax=Paenibacillus sp. NAIST15-1 TaxID=1605994 RepID=UPI0009F9E3DD|nr:class I SAM-dependent methyltransferase [Paenibacillus sp. NAIST15-1]